MQMHVHTRVSVCLRVWAAATVVSLTLHVHVFVYSTRRPGLIQLAASQKQRISHFDEAQESGRRRTNK